MENHEKDILIGKIRYTNAWPMYHHFDVNRLTKPSRLVVEVPSVLNQGILDKTLDVAPVSSFAYGVGSEQLMVLPDLSVSSYGAVKSILLFSRKPIEELGDVSIALTNTSATSVNLLKIIMNKKFGANPSYVVCEPRLDMMMAEHDAALLIGDHAIRASWEDHGFIVTDLGEIWRSWTGHSMTFAVWTVHTLFAEQNQDFIGELVAAFVHSKQQSLAHLDSLVAAACKEIGGTQHYWHSYFTNLCYDFNDKIQAGLQLYFDYAYELGLLNHKVHIQLWSNNTLTQVKE